MREQFYISVLYVLVCMCIFMSKCASLCVKSFAYCFCVLLLTGAIGALLCQSNMGTFQPKAVFKFYSLVVKISDTNIYSLKCIFLTFFK